uniref:6-phosphogluconate dehydrogenase, decarboxylating n=1 Tax=Hordeum vulgare subsp. vulgare TaxID=112509 RepID=A0A8I6YA06_HORVV
MYGHRGYGMALTRIGLAGLAVMGQNLALNIAEKGFPISVYNRTTSKVDETVQRAKLEGNLPLYGFHDPASFVNSIQKPRVVIMLVKAGAPVDQTIATLAAHLEQGDCIVDGGNEWYENTERREKAMEERGLLYLGMGVSGGEEGARHGPSMMPGGSLEAYQYIEDILLKVSAQVPDSGPCVTYIGKGGSGNFVKMVHNGIEYGDMQLIAEAYDVLKSVGKLTNGELQQVFAEWNKGELLSFLVEITADIFSIKDDQGEGYLVDKVLDKTGMKGTGKWTVQQAAELSVAAPTIEASLDSRFLSGLKDERVAASKIFQGDYSSGETVDKAQLIEDVRKALYASKICSYAQGMNIIKAKSTEKGWGLNLGELARIWKGGCIIRASFLDRIKKAYDRNGELANLLIDPEFAQEIMDRQAAWRRVVCLAINNGVSTPGMSASLAYFDSYRRDRLPANLVQAQRDYFGAHTYERVDMPGSFHTEWYKIANSKI